MDYQEPKWQEPPRVWCEKGQWYVKPEGTFIAFKCSKSIAKTWEKRLNIKED